MAQKKESGRAYLKYHSIERQKFDHKLNFLAMLIHNHHALLSENGSRTSSVHLTNTEHFGRFYVMEWELYARKFHTALRRGKK